MTTRTPVNTVIIRKIVNHYAMIEADIASLSEQITQQLTVTYRQTIARQLVLYGCQKPVTGPDAISAAWIAARAKKDGEGIAKTYNAQLENEVQRIYNANPRSNRFAYMRALDVWTLKRNAYKVPSISLNTMTAAREYAQTRFIEENGIEGVFVLVGPPPVCEKCLRIKGNGPKPFRFTQKPENRLPAHVGCPHRYEQLTPTPIACDELTWTG